MDDPLLNLPLIVVPQSPPMRARSRDPISGPPAQQKPAFTPQAQTQDGKPAVPAQQAQLPSRNMSILDKVIFAITGTPDSLRTPEDRQKAQSKRADAGRMAANAANGDLGDSYMNAPNAGGSGGDLGNIINKLTRMFKG